MSTKALSQAVTALAITPLLVVALAGCSSDAAEADQTSSVQAPATEPASSASPDVEPEPTDAAERTDAAAQEETCDWDSPRLTASADVPTGQDGDLQTLIVGSWQHTYTDEGSGFEEVTNDHRYVFPSPDRMLYCQHVPGATEYAENAANITLNGTVIELPGGAYSYTITAWDEDTLVWDNPVGGGYVYLLERR